MIYIYGKNSMIHNLSHPSINVVAFPQGKKTLDGVLV